jgi:catechol 2,3-dioxygenase-like lactoylglutathione lyase family enzyme
MLGDTTIQRMDHVGVVVDDLEAATAFFVELGMELEGEAPVEGRWVDRVVGLDDVRVDIAMMRTPDGHGRLELTKFHTPTAVAAEPENAPANTLGIRRITFAVEDIEDVLARLHTHGAELVGELEQYEDSYRLCYVRGPEGIILALAEQLSSRMTVRLSYHKVDRSGDRRSETDVCRVNPRRTRRNEGLDKVKYGVGQDFRCRAVDFLARRSSYCVTIW